MPLHNQYTLTNDPARNEVLVALLAAAGFDSFQETDRGLLAFAPAAEDARWRAELDALTPRFAFGYTVRALADKNWNEEWERQFNPLTVGDRLHVRAAFHPPAPEVEQELIITPKMAFGTGHHPTTYLMCEMLMERDLRGLRVFDYGSGTGLLAILALRLGAASADAVDIEHWSAENTLENAVANGVALGTVTHGTLDDVPAGPPYDLILANINRNVILASAGALRDRLAPGGTALFSGILAADEQLLHARLSALGYRHRETRRREDWRAFAFTRD